MLSRLPFYFLTGCLTLITLTSAVSSGNAQLFNSTVDQLPVSDRSTLKSGKALVTGEKGNYVARVLVKSSQDTAWNVLTDYGSSSKFIPNVVSSKVLESNGNRKVIEQVDARQIFFVNVRSRIRSSVTETAKTRIDFQLTDGDLQSLKGYWTVEPIAAFSGAKADQVLITQVVEAQPKSGTPKDIFYNLFKDSLGKNLSAISQEVGRRSR